MGQIGLRLLGFFLALLGSAQANFDYFYFAANGTCPGILFQCPGPASLCAHEAVLDKFYCCSGQDYPVCRTSYSTCEGNNGGSSSSQISCANGNSPWCCLSGTESCTQRAGQINVCLATETNIVANVTTAVLNETFSSLSSANPSATAYTINVKQLTAPTATTATSQTSGSPSASLEKGTPSSTATPNSSGSISGGAIAGIVIGAVAVIAIIAAAAATLLRRRKRTHVQVQSIHIDGPRVDDKSAHLGEYEMLPTTYETPQHPIMSQKMPENPIIEMDAATSTQELGDYRDVAELYSEPAELTGSDYTPKAPIETERTTSPAK